jgi:KAP-like P-loop domain-containing protein
VAEPPERPVSSKPPPVRADPSAPSDHVEQPEPWPFLAVILVASPSAEGSSEPPNRRTRGLGFFVTDRLVVTLRLAETSEIDAVSLWSDPARTEYPVRQIAEDARIAILEVPVSVGLSSSDVAPPVGEPILKTVGMIAQLDDDRTRLRMTTGRIEDVHDDQFTFADFPYVEWATAMGSPVVVDGAVVGIVGTSGTSRSVTAFAITQLGSLLPFDLAGGFSSDAVDPERGIPLERDRLDVGVYVKMLAALIADRSTPVPLSIGLFGEWGSGKSFFMGLLRNQVQVLASQGSEHVYPNIIQIPFNAWHYADTNLWASLGEEIWRKLADPEPSASQQRGALLADLAAASPRRHELEVATARAEAETARLTADIARAATSRNVSTRNLARSIVAAAGDDGPALESALGRLGIQDEVERGQLLDDALRGVVTDVRATQRALTGRGALFAASAIALAVALIALSVVTSPQAAEWLAGTGVTALVTGISIALVVAERTRSGLATVRRVANTLASSIDAEAQQALNEQLEALRHAKAEERVLRAQRDEVVARVADLGRELAALRPDQRLYALLSERAASDDYRRHLGLISTIRRDFEQLVERLRDWGTDPAADVGPRPIDRIVLYIDDLDRCHATQVVQVLQAVHLLLALELFVVVVGVDPRWLLRSLRDEYPNLLGSTDTTTSTFQAAPEDYLEKIVNVPFVLPRMDTTRFRALLEGFAGDENSHHSQGPNEPANAANADIADEASTDTASSDLTEEPASQLASQPTTSQSTSPPITGAAAPRTLTKPELTLLGELGPLVETPREAKRLMNLYRMVRSTRDLSPAAQFIGDDGTPGEYQAVAILLGLVSGHARLLAPVLTALPDPSRAALGGLSHRDPEITWATFAAGLAPRVGSPLWTNDVIGPIPSDDLVHWRRLDAGLQRATALVTLSDLKPFQYWAPRIARFSFLLSPHSFDSETPTTPGSPTA